MPTSDKRGRAWNGKWCTYCRADTHNDAECWCTRPADWHPGQFVPIDAGWIRKEFAPRSAALPQPIADMISNQQEPTEDMRRAATLVASRSSALTPEAALTQARAMTTGIYGRLRELLDSYTKPCIDECHHVHCPLLRDLHKVMSDSRTEAVNAANSATRPSKEDAYRRAFTLTLAAAMAAGWLESAPTMKARAVAYLHSADLDVPGMTCEKVLHDALGLPTDAERAYATSATPAENGKTK